MANESATDADGRYANSFRVGFNAYEFILDFGQQYDDGPARTHTRIVTNTAVARELCEQLELSLWQHEEKYRRGEPLK